MGFVVGDCWVRVVCGWCGGGDEVGGVVVFVVGVW